MTPTELNSVSELVRLCAREELLPRFTRIGHQVKADGSLLTEADLAMNQRLLGELTRQFPLIACLSEEMTESEQRAALGAHGPVWCLDPLDGTSNFAAGIPIFGVSLALLQGGLPIAAVIYDPGRDELFTALRGAGATLNGEHLHVPGTSDRLTRSIALVDFKRLDIELRRRLLTAPPYSSQRNFGSCALEWAWLAAGRGHVALHGGQKLWDYAAGVLLLEEAGGMALTLDGETVFRPQLTPRSVVASTQADLFREWCEWLGVPSGDAMG